MSNQEWDEITNSFPNVNDGTTEDWNGLIILSHALLCIWLRIHAGIKVDPRLLSK